MWRDNGATEGLLDTNKLNGGTKEEEQWQTEEQEWWPRRTKKFLKSKSGDGEEVNAVRRNGGGMRARE